MLSAAVAAIGAFAFAPALVNIEKRVDLNSPDGQEIASIVASLGESCGEK
jgi:hypothetical protein